MLLKARHPCQAFDFTEFRTSHCLCPAEFPSTSVLLKYSYNTSLTLILCLEALLRPDPCQKATPNDRRNWMEPDLGFCPYTPRPRTLRPRTLTWAPLVTHIGAGGMTKEQSLKTSFVHFTKLFTHSFIQSAIHSFTYSFIHPFIHPLVYPPFTARVSLVPHQGTLCPGQFEDHVYGPHV